MRNIEKYYRAVSAEDALKVYQNTDGAAVLGGCWYLRMGAKNISTGIDLSALELDRITVRDGSTELGAMVSLRALETDKNILENFGYLFKDACADIVGVQLRNCATIGGTVAGRYPFSDILTAMSVLDVTIAFASGTSMSLAEYMNSKKLSKDIITKIIIQNNIKKAVFNSVRNSHGDYAVLNCACAVTDGKYSLAVGARPQKAVRVAEAEEFLNNNEINEKTAEEAGRICAGTLDFQDNIRGKADYRKAVCVPLVKRAVMGAAHAG
jgi:CO/xanthine dehydrogenase FAD-binding subunit